MAIQRLILAALLLLALAAAAAAEDAAGTPDGGQDTLGESDGYVDAAAGSTEQHYCFVTGQPWEPSPQRIEVIFRENGHLKRARFLNFGYYVYALRTFQKAGRDMAVDKVSIVDYSTFGTPNEHMIEIDRENPNAWFAFTDKKIKGAKAPYVFAFDNKEAADAFSRDNGGKVQDYAAVLNKIARGLNVVDDDPKADEFGQQLMGN